MGLVGRVLAKSTTFPCKDFFVPQTPFLVQISGKFSGKIGCGEQTKSPGGKVVDEKEHKDARCEFSQVSGLISVGRKKKIFFLFFFLAWSHV